MILIRFLIRSLIIIFLIDTCYADIIVDTSANTTGGAVTSSPMSDSNSTTTIGDLITGPSTAIMEILLQVPQQPRLEIHQLQAGIQQLHQITLHLKYRFLLLIVQLTTQPHRVWDRRQLEPLLFP